MALTSDWARWREAPGRRRAMAPTETLFSGPVRLLPRAKGMKTSAGVLMGRKSGGSTPVTVYSAPSSRMGLPAMARSEPKRRCQRPWETIAALRAPGLSSSGRNSRPRWGWTPNSAQEAGVDPLGGDAFGIADALAGEDHGSGGVGRGGLEGGGLADDVRHVGIADEVEGDAAPGVLAPEPDEVIGVAVGEGAEQDGVDDAEDGGIGADTERQGDHRGRGEAGGSAGGCGGRSGGRGKGASWG